MPGRSRPLASAHHPVHPSIAGLPSTLSGRRFVVEDSPSADVVRAMGGTVVNPGRKTVRRPEGGSRSRLSLRSTSRGRPRGRQPPPRVVVDLDDCVDEVVSDGWSPTPSDDDRRRAPVKAQRRRRARGRTSPVPPSKAVKQATLVAHYLLRSGERSHALSGFSLLVFGDLQVMSREDVVHIIHRHGGRVCYGMEARTTHMLIGGVDTSPRLDPVTHLSSRSALPPTINEAGLLHLIIASLELADGPHGAAATARRRKVMADLAAQQDAPLAASKAPPTTPKPRWSFSPKVERPVDASPPPLPRGTTVKAVAVKRLEGLTFVLLPTLSIPQRRQVKVLIIANGGKLTDSVPAADFCVGSDESAARSLSPGRQRSGRGGRTISMRDLRKLLKGGPSPARRPRSTSRPRSAMRSGMAPSGSSPVKGVLGWGGPGGRQHGGGAATVRRKVPGSSPPSRNGAPGGRVHRRPASQEVKEEADVGHRRGVRSAAVEHTVVPGTPLSTAPPPPPGVPHAAPVSDAAAPVTPAVARGTPASATTPAARGTPGGSPPPSTRKYVSPEPALPPGPVTPSAQSSPAVVWQAFYVGADGVAGVGGSTISPVPLSPKDVKWLSFRVDGRPVSVIATCDMAHLLAVVRSRLGLLPSAPLRLFDEGLEVLSPAAIADGSELSLVDVTADNPSDWSADGGGVDGGADGEEDTGKLWSEGEDEDEAPVAGTPVVTFGTNTPSSGVVAGTPHAAVSPLTTGSSPSPLQHTTPAYGSIVGTPSSNVAHPTPQPDSAVIMRPTPPVDTDALAAAVSRAMAGTQAAGSPATPDTFASVVDAQVSDTSGLLSSDSGTPATLPKASPYTVQSALSSSMDAMDHVDGVTSPVEGLPPWIKAASPESPARPSSPTEQAVERPVFVFTGRFQDSIDRLKGLVYRRGGVVEETMTPGTKFLVLGTDGYGHLYKHSAQYRRAQRTGVQVVDEAAFVELLTSPMPARRPHGGHADPLLTPPKGKRAPPGLDASHWSGQATSGTPAGSPMTPTSAARMPNRRLFVAQSVASQGGDELSPLHPSMVL